MEKCFSVKTLFLGYLNVRRHSRFSSHLAYAKKFNWLTLFCQTLLSFSLLSFSLLSFSILTLFFLSFSLLTFSLLSFSLLSFSFLLTFLLLFITFFFSFYPNPLSLSWTNHREKHHVSFCLYFKTMENM